MRTRTRLAGTALAALALLGMAACGGKSSSSSSASGADQADSGKKVTLSLVAYSTPQAAYDAIIAAYKQTPQGKNVTFTESFGASGDQSRAVAAGLKADIVAFSLETDMTRLVKANMVASTWQDNPYKGMVTDSVVALVTRKGNPKGIKDWPDLTKDGVQVITPNPFSSGAARWNIMGAYGAQIKEGKSEADALAYVKSMLSHVAVQDESGRKALQTFTGGKGDVLISYENEAIFAQQKQQAIDYTIPNNTLLIENPVAVTSSSEHAKEAKEFYDYLFTKDAQKIFAANGYRPVVTGVDGADKFPTPSGLFTIADLGGWSDVSKKFFDTDTGLITKIERDLGVSVDKK